VSGALIGERWRIGSEVVLEVTCGRIPVPSSRTIWARRGWVKRFTLKGAPGAYLRVIEPGEIRAGDAIEIVHRPDHDVTVALQFRAVTTERELLPRLLPAGEALHPDPSRRPGNMSRNTRADLVPRPVRHGVRHVFVTDLEGLCRDRTGLLRVTNLAP
jgi:MOSC domain-containing protein YiiM